MASGPTQIKTPPSGARLLRGSCGTAESCRPWPEGPLPSPEATGSRCPSARRLIRAPGRSSSRETPRWTSSAARPRGAVGGPSNKRPEASHGHEGPVVSRVTARLDLARTTSSRPGPGQHPSSYLARVASARARLAAPGQGFFSFETPGSPPAPAHEEPEATRDPRPPPEEVPPAAIPSPPPTRRIESPEAAAAVPATGGEKAKARDILAAIRTLKRIEREHRPATADERQTLARFGGFGAVALSLFPDPVTGRYKDAGWQALGEELRIAPHARGIRRVPRRTTFNAFYTSPVVIAAMHEALARLGVPDDATVLEPGCGTGNFMGQAPEGMRFIGVELDSHLRPHRPGPPPRATTSASRTSATRSCPRAASTP